jgi:hypothetical protein
MTRDGTGWGAAIDTVDTGDTGVYGAGDAGRAARLVDRADEPADYGRWVRRWTWPALLAAAIVAGMVIAGVDVWRACAVAAGVAVALWAVIASMATPRIAWHDDVPGRRYYATSHWEVPALDGARESDATFGYYLRPRLWSLAADLLTSRGIDPDGAEARRLVGPRIHDVLTGANTDPRTVTSSVPAISHTIARLAVDPTLPGRTPVDTPALAGLAGAPRVHRRARPGAQADPAAPAKGPDA